MRNQQEIEKAQAKVCGRYKCEFVASAPDSKLGIALQTLGKLPINGLRHLPEKGTNGWYVWCGTELSQASDFFSPLHASHVGECCAEILPYLGLPPGFRFLLGGDHVEVWFDAKLLDV